MFAENVEFIRSSKVQKSEVPPVESQGLNQPPTVFCPTAERQHQRALSSSTAVKCK